MFILPRTHFRQDSTCMEGSLARHTTHVKRHKEERRLLRPQCSPQHASLSFYRLYTTPWQEIPKDAGLLDPGCAGCCNPAMIQIRANHRLVDFVTKLECKSMIDDSRTQYDQQNPSQR